MDYLRIVWIALIVISVPSGLVIFAIKGPFKHWLDEDDKSKNSAAVEDLSSSY